MFASPAPIPDLTRAEAVEVLAHAKELIRALPLPPETVVRGPWKAPLRVVSNQEQDR